MDSVRKEVSSAWVQRHDDDTETRPDQKGHECLGHGRDRCRAKVVRDLPR